MGATASALVVYYIATFTPINGLAHAFFGFVSAVAAGWLTSLIYRGNPRGATPGAA